LLIAVFQFLEQYLTYNNYPVNICECMNEIIPRIHPVDMSRLTSAENILCFNSTL
jgi:hypothetical protein